MRIYYRGADALITQNQFVWLTETPQVFAIAELRAARLSRRKVKGAWAPATAVAAGASALVLTPGFVYLDSPLARLSLVGVALLIVTLAIVRRRTGSRWELRASHRGQEVTIYSALDVTTFNQVTRALGRVLESVPAGHVRRPTVAA